MSTRDEPQTPNGDVASKPVVANKPPKPKNPEDVAVGQRVRAARIRSGLSREAVDAALPEGLKFRTYGAIERGDRHVRPHEFAPLAAALQTTVEDLRDPAPEQAESLLQRVELLLLHQNALLERQSLILDRIEKAVDRDVEAQAEIRAGTEALRLAANRLVVGDPPAGEPDRPLVPPPA